MDEAGVIWDILAYAIEQRRQDGSNQWQNGYPSPQSVIDDVRHGYGHVLTENGKILVYAAIIFDIEPAYTAIQGRWLSDGDYVVVHRVASSPEAKQKGMATQLFRHIESLAISKGVYSIKVDTNHDNLPMLRIMDRLGYTYCGQVYFNNSPRRAFEKILNK